MNNVSAQLNELEAAQAEAAHYKQLFEKTLIDKELSEAAREHNAFRIRQFLDLNRGRCRVDESGKVQMSVENRDEDGNVIVDWVPPSQGVERIKMNTDEYGNLFKEYIPKDRGGDAESSASPDAPVENLTIEEKAQRFKEDPTSLGLKPKTY